MYESREEDTNGYIIVAILWLNDSLAYLQIYKHLSTLRDES